MAVPEETCDVLVVGAGPSGAVISHKLAADGFDVVCLEQGGWVSPADYPANHAEWELLIQHQWSHDPNVRGLPSDYPLDVSDSDLAPVMFNAVGGSSVYFGAQWPRLLPSDFKVRSVDGVADDWPITYQDLSPHYDRVDQLVGVSGLEGNPAYPPGLTFPLPPHPIGRAGMVAARGLNKLGWHWWPGTNAIPSQKFRELAQCARVGTCEWGCPEGAKASSDLAFWPHTLRSGARLITGARVREVLTGSDGQATGALWIDRSGQEHRQLARCVVLCANGIGTPRLLLLSASARHPDGLANSSGLVGQNLMLHPNCAVLGLYEEELENYRGPAGELINSLEFYDTRAEHDFVRGAKMHAVPFPGPLNLVEFYRAEAYEQVWGPAIHDIVEHHSRALLWAVNVEDLPERSNRVSLDPVLTDGDGLPAPKITYRISENSRKLLAFTLERMTEVHEASGATSTIGLPLTPDQPGHLLGTARMGTDPATSVVDLFGRSHDVPNLFLADGSIFVTSGAANPTCTIHALALRIADHISATARAQRTPATATVIAAPHGQISVPPRYATPRALTEAESQVLTRVARVLVPEHAGRPGAADEPGFGQAVRTAADARADAFAVLQDTLAALASLDQRDLENRLPDLMDRDPGAFQVLSTIVAGAWLLTPTVRDRIGYRGPERKLAGAFEAASQLDSGLLDPVLEMSAEDPPRWAR
jgi:choline dehydrogenase-like flavoprotein